MFTKEELKKYNEFMIGKGAPIERDNVGYNKPDFMKMYWIGMLAVEYNDLECYAITRCLNHYKNTQLKDVKDDIEETYDFYAEKFKTLSDGEIKDIESCDDHSRSDFDSHYVRLISVRDDTETILARLDSGAIKEYVSIDLRSFGGRWKKIDGNYFIEVPFASVKTFLEVAEKTGKIGYKPDETFKEFLETHLSKYLESYDLNGFLPIKLEDVEHSKDCVIVRYDAMQYAQDNDVLPRVDIRQFGGTWITIDGRWCMEIPFTAINDFLAFSKTEFLSLIPENATW